MPQPPNDVRSIAADVLAEVAPEELPQLDAALAELERDPDRVVRPRDDELGFGEVIFGATTALVVTWMVEQVLGFAAGLVLETATKPLRSRLVRFLLRIPPIRRFRRRRPLATAPPRPLTPQELATVKAATLESAATAGVAPNVAALLADAIIGRLATQP